MQSLAQNMKAQFLFMSPGREICRSNKIISMRKISEQVCGRFGGLQLGIPGYNIAVIKKYLDCLTR